MNTSLMHALMIVRLECSRALDALQENRPIPHQLSTALAMLDEELSSESYRQRVLAAELAATDRSRAYTAEEQAAQEMAAAARADAAVGERLASLERLRSLAQEHGLINADGVITAKLEEAVGLRLVRAEPAEGEGVKIEVGLPFPEPPSA